MLQEQKRVESRHSASTEEPSILKIPTRRVPFAPGETSAPPLRDVPMFLIDASDIHAETVRHPEERCFSLYQSILQSAPDRHFLLSPPMPPSGERDFPAMNPLLKAQPFLHAFLTAALRASETGQVSILFPAVQSVQEIHEARRALGTVMGELYERGEYFDETLRSGITLATPQALTNSRRLLEEADFAVIDTEAISHTVSGLLPQMSLVEIGVGNAHILGRFAAICGKAATDPRALPHLLAMGADALIMPAP